MEIDPGQQLDNTFVALGGVRDELT